MRELILFTLVAMLIVDGNAARLAVSVTRILSHLTSHLKRGNYVNGIPKEKIKTLGRRSKYWEMLPTAQKSRYLNMMRFIVKDKNEDYHIGDAEFQNTAIAGTVPYANLAFELMNPAVVNHPKYEFPDKLEKMKNVSKSDFHFSKLMQALAKFMNIQKDVDSRSRRYSYECPTCKTPFVQGTTMCFKCSAELRPEGYVKVVPENKEATYHTFQAFNAVASGVEKLRLLPPDRQHELIVAHLQGGVNSGWPLFEQQDKKRIMKQVFRTFDILHYKYDKKTKFLTVDLIYSVIKYCVKQKLYLPYVLFYRTQGGTDGTKHRCVFGAHFIQKLFAAVYSVGKELGYVDFPDAPNKNRMWLDKVFTKRLPGVGGLPIMAQANWDEMFTAIKERMPNKEDGKLVPMSAAIISKKFGYSLPPGDYEVNVIGDDFPGFDTGQVAEDYEELVKHKALGWLFEWMINDMKYSVVWISNKEMLDIQYKSGFTLTSDFGSHLHRKCEYNAAAANNAHILAYINLSDDSIGFVIGLTPQMINDYLLKFGLRIKIDDSYNYAEAPFVTFLKVDIGELTKGILSICGNLTSRYYGICHQERNIEKDSLNPEDTDVRGIFEVTGVIEVDAFISKLASYGNDELGKSFVHFILDLLKDTPLGRDTILGISHIKASVTYAPYRSDLEIGFPPNWLTELNLTGLLTDPKKYR